MVEYVYTNNRIGSYFSSKLYIYLQVITRLKY